eukprot:361245_1
MEEAMPKPDIEKNMIYMIQVLFSLEFCVLVLYLFHYCNIIHIIQLKYRLPVFKRYALFDPWTFEIIADEIESEWKKPRTGEQERSRKHDVKACLFAVLGLMSTGMSDLAMEAVCEMPASLINIEFERIQRDVQ